MSDKPSQVVPADLAQRLLAAAQAINELSARLVETAAAPNPPIGLAAAGGSAGLTLTPGQRAICERVINVFETGTVRGKYGAIAIFEDGPNDIRQITYGRSQTTEYGNLRELVERYVAAAGRFADRLRPFVQLIGRTALVDDETFKDLLRRAGNEDPIMEQVQDVFFAARYFEPAMAWASRNGFTRALSALVIYDSFIHSGGILDFLRARFAEVPPARGGNEQTWLREYVDTRHAWLLGHHRPAVRASAYRTRDLAREIARGNWDLAQLPIMANGVPVDAGGMALGSTPVAPPAADDIPYLGRDGGVRVASPRSGEAVWCESSALGSRSGSRSAMGLAGDSADVAGRILQSRRISLATGHVSGVQDDATARQNIEDAAAGQEARRSAYGNAPGGSVPLDQRMLDGLLTLSETYSVSVSEFVGGSHSPNSFHYAGVAFDIASLNGLPIGHPNGRGDVAAFMARCGELGATEVLGPGFPGHDTHIHAAWPLR